MATTGVILPTDPPELASRRLLGVPLACWALRALRLSPEVSRVVALRPHPEAASALERHGVCSVEDAPGGAVVEATPTRPFCAIAAPETPIERLTVASEADLELAEAVARGLAPSHPCIKGVRRLRLPLTVEVRAVVSDVDGCLTDGRLAMAADGSAGRFFHTQDGLGTHLLRKAGIAVGWLSATSEGRSTLARAEMLGLERGHVDVGKGDKGERFTALCGRMGVSPEQVIYLGDDVNDLPAMERAGLSACPADAAAAVRGRVDLLLETPGGRGAFRELADVLLGG